MEIRCAGPQSGVQCVTQSGMLLSNKGWCSANTPLKKQYGAVVSLSFLIRLLLKVPAYVFANSVSKSEGLVLGCIDAEFCN